MKLTGKVIGVQAASEFDDNIERVVIKVTEADWLYATFRTRNLDGFKLDDELEITIEKANRFAGVPFMTQETEEVALHA
jgi:uncharacterized protein YuzE